MKEYKVLTQRDEFFLGKFDFEKIEHALNTYAAEGWHVVGTTMAIEASVVGKAREEFIVILERDK